MARILADYTSARATREATRYPLPAGCPCAYPPCVAQRKWLDERFGGE
ncbi:hypothetical protein [Kitasatospora sp. NPDC088134]